jgi:hypothetical protein
MPSTVSIYYLSIARGVRVYLSSFRRRLTRPLVLDKCEGWNPFSSYGDGRSEHTGVYRQEEDYYEFQRVRERPLRLLQ